MYLCAGVTLLVDTEAGQYLHQIVTVSSNLFLSCEFTVCIFSLCNGHGILPIVCLGK